MSVDDPLLTDDARALVADLTVRKQSIATAESLTACLLAATLAGVPGASEVLRGGLVTYTAHMKIVLAGVAPQILEEVGPVAAPTARALAVGARQRCEATWGVGLTGVAGPDLQEGMPVGIVYVAVSGITSGEVVRRLDLSGSRRQIRDGAVEGALDLLATVLGG